MIRKLALAVSWRGDDAARVRSLVLMVAAAVRFLLTGLLAAALSITFALTIIIDVLGRRIARGASVLWLLIGRRLSRNDFDPPAATVETTSAWGTV